MIKKNHNEKNEEKQVEVRVLACGQSKLPPKSLCSHHTFYGFVSSRGVLQQSSSSGGGGEAVAHTHTHFPFNFTENEIQTIQLIESYNKRTETECKGEKKKKRKNDEKRLNIQMIACNLNENVIFLFAFY